MARTTVDIDDKTLGLAAKELGTSSKVDTVNAALAFVANRRRLASAFADPLIWGSPDLADPEVRAEARRCLHQLGPGHVDGELFDSADEVGAEPGGGAGHLDVGNAWQ